MRHDHWDGRLSPLRSRSSYRKRRLRVEIPPELFQTAFANFTRGAEGFAMSLSDETHRKFALRYLEYLQDIARGADLLKPKGGGFRPASRLICAELERLFRCYFASADGIVAA